MPDTRFRAKAEAIAKSVWGHAPEVAAQVIERELEAAFQQAMRSELERVVRLRFVRLGHFTAIARMRAFQSALRIADHHDAPFGHLQALESKVEESRRAAAGELPEDA